MKVSGSVINNNVYLAFLLTVLAGLSTGIGAIIILYIKKIDKKLMSIVLGFSAGVMIYVSMVELLSLSSKTISNYFNYKIGNLISIISFFAGMFIIAVVDKILPEEKNPHDLKTEDNKLMRIGIFTAVALAIHNFPEGIASFISALQEPNIAFPIIIAIAMHNIPEGIAVAVPIYCATKSRRKAFYYSFASGLFEPLGALIGYLVLLPFLNDAIYGILFGIVAGIMVFISFDELLPAAKEYGEHHLSIYGLILGMFFMAISIWLSVY